MKAKFTIKNDETIMIGQDYVSNGHWMLKRELLYTYQEPKTALKKLIPLKDGAYRSGIGAGEPDIDGLPEFETIIPKDLSSYKPVEFTGRANVGVHNLEVSALIYDLDSTEIGVAPRYAPLLKLGHRVLGLDANSALIIVDSDNEVLGLVMPVRIGGAE